MKICRIIERGTFSKRGKDRIEATFEHRKKGTMVMKQVLILSTSLRKGGNSEALARAFAQGAKDAGHQVEMLSLVGKNIQFCRGCLACQETGSCVIKDDSLQINEKMLHADVIVFATPIYYYEMSGQMKTLLDRANPLFTREYSFREIYLLATAAEEDRAAMDRAVAGLEGWIACFEKAKLEGTLFAGGVTNIGDISGNAAPQEARKMGENV